MALSKRPAQKGGIGQMGIGTSVFLFVVGAILAFAVHIPVDGVNVHALGIILMVVGVLGGGASLLFWNSWGGWGAPGGRVYRRPPLVVDAGRPASVIVPEVPVAPVVQVVGGVQPVVPVVGGVQPVVPVVGGVQPGVPVVGGAQPVARRRLRVRRTTIYEDRL